jgi:hypothetical protein
MVLLHTSTSTLWGDYKKLHFESESTKCYFNQMQFSVSLKSSHQFSSQSFSASACRNERPLVPDLVVFWTWRPKIHCREISRKPCAYFMLF